MRFLGTMFVYTVFALFLGWGILSLVHGNPWVLVAAALTYLTLLIRIGCLPKSPP